MRLLVFGTFDRLHEGHKVMLAEAKTHGEVAVCLATDAIVERLKGTPPVQDYESRRRALQASGLVADVQVADPVEGTYECLKRLQPDLIAFGYDQTALRENFVNWQQQTGDETPYIVLQPYRPDTYKSSFLRP